MDFDGRSIVFKALFGSHNYNLNDETSDKDYKYFVLPTFDDLYSGKMYSTSKIGLTEDYDVHDIRKLVHLFWKANINFIEILYSKEIEHYIHGKYLVSPTKPEYQEYADSYIRGHMFPQISEMFDMRQEIVAMNLPYLYNACVGMYCQKMAQIKKTMEGKTDNPVIIESVRKYGYDTKNACHAYRVLDFLRRFRDFDWDFQKAIWYNDTGTRERDYMLSIKHGEWLWDDFREMISTTNDIVSGYEKYYRVQPPNEGTKERLSELIKDLVRKSLT
jgi:Predicted nucleotidyltransferase